MPVQILQVDAFTDRPFAGNPAAVCVLHRAADEGWMQAVAREMNLSETAFLLARSDGGWDLRWFTPTVEVDLCGHATLASAHILWSEGHAKGGELLAFHTRSGMLTAEESDGWIELDFPAADPSDPSVEVRELASEAEVRAYQPDFEALARLPARVVYVTAPAVARGFDYTLRVFGPRVGIAEDPVTGSAQCTLGPLWAARLDKQELMALQASARGGVLRVRLAGDRVKIAGQAVTVMRAELSG